MEMQGPEIEIIGEDDFDSRYGALLKVESLDGHQTSLPEFGPCFIDAAVEVKELRRNRHKQQSNLFKQTQRASDLASREWRIEHYCSCC
jgi:hypothetical protein